MKFFNFSDLKAYVFQESRFGLISVHSLEIKWQGPEAITRLHLLLSVCEAIPLKPHVPSRRGAQLDTGEILLLTFCSLG
jgi:hypothetical protein